MTASDHHLPNTGQGRPDNVHLPQRSIAVIVPIHGNQADAVQTLRVLEQQTHKNVEVCIIDDGSIPPLRPVDSFLPLTWHRHREQQGPGAARNTGARLSSSPFLLFFDSDDRPDPSWLEELLAEVIRTSSPLACCGVRFAEPTGRVVPKLPRQTYSGIKIPALFLAGSFVVSRELFSTVGGYWEDLRHSENWELGLRLMTELQRRHETGATLDVPLITVHRRPEAGRYDTQKIHAVRLILDRHRDYFAHQSATKAAFYSIAGVSASRLGSWDEATKNFVAAVQSQPLNLKAWLRLLLASTPRLRDRVW